MIIRGHGERAKEKQKGYQKIVRALSLDIQVTHGFGIELTIPFQVLVLLLMQAYLYDLIGSIYSWILIYCGFSELINPAHVYMCTLSYMVQIGFLLNANSSG